MPENSEAFQARLEQAAAQCRDLLLSERNSQGHWEGELSTSALSTATASMALIQVRGAIREESLDCGADEPRLTQLIDGGLRWLLDHQNEDGGWGDTVKSISNISTTMLVRAVLNVEDATTLDIPQQTLSQADAYLTEHGGVEGIRRRYGRDRTFSVPILMQAALGGLVEWKEVSQLPFELSCLPPDWYKWAQLPVVSYALPALIAIGLLKHRRQPTWFLHWRWLRSAAAPSALKVLRRIQPETGGFLEAAPLTSFVTMSLVAAGEGKQPVVREAVRFLIDSVRPDGSWPIDTNLATWTTTLSLKACGDHFPAEEIDPVCDWLLNQQYRTVHPYTNADPGGWAWTDLSGGVPDADDTPGAILALEGIRDRVDHSRQQRIDEAIGVGCKWLLSLQNRDGGWPTFCRGWGKLPFDRSSPDITAHVLRALKLLGDSTLQARRKGFQFLNREQRSDGAWLPLWFGNQFANEDENPVYGTSRVLLAYADYLETSSGSIADLSRLQSGAQFLVNIQNEDGGWGGASGVQSSVEETGLAVEALIRCKADSGSIQRGLNWLILRVESGEIEEATPIGFYFAKLWYFEKLYPLVFAAHALRYGCEIQ